MQLSGEYKRRHFLIALLTQQKLSQKVENFYSAGNSNNKFSPNFCFSLTRSIEQSLPTIIGMSGGAPFRRRRL